MAAITTNDAKYFISICVNSISLLICNNLLNNSSYYPLNLTLMKVILLFEVLSYLGNSA